jgi:hypothetical protein
VPAPLALWNSLVTAERIPLEPALFNSSKKTSAAYLTGMFFLFYFIGVAN